MTREDDAVYSFMHTLNENQFTLETIDKAVRYGFQQGKKQGFKEGDMHALDYTLIYFGDNETLKMEVKSLKKCLRGIVYMAESGLHTKNELAFARCIAKAKELCKE